MNYICQSVRGLAVTFRSVTVQRSPYFSAMLVFLTTSGTTSVKWNFWGFSTEGRGWRRCDYSVRRGIEYGAYPTCSPTVNWLTPERVELRLHVLVSSHNIGLLLVQRDSIILITATLKTLRPSLFLYVTCHGMVVYRRFETAYMSHFWTWGQ